MMINSSGEQTPETSLLSQVKQKGISVLWHNAKIRAILILICANVFNNLVAFLMNLFIARKFGPGSYGVFALAMSFMETIHLVTDLGLNLTIVRFYNLYKDNADQQRKLLVSVLVLKFFIVMALILVALPCGSMLLKWFRLHGEYLTLITLSVASVGLFGLWTYYKNLLQAHRRFSKLAFYVVLYAIFRIGCFSTAYVILSPSVDLSTVFISLYTIPLLIAIYVGLFPLVFPLFKQGVPQPSVMKNIILKVLKYGKWVAISGVCNSFIYRAIQFILAARTSNYELGIFSAGFVFTLAFSPFNVAVRTVFFPHATAFDDGAMKRHFTRVKKFFPYYVGLIIVGIAMLAFVQITFLGEQYTRALPVFLITSFSLTLMIFVGLVSMLVHTMMRPEIDAYTNIGRLIVSCVLVYILAPSIGAIGGAISYAIPVVLGELLMALYVMRLIHERK